MNSRLQQFLELEKLSPARLADMLGVQRSGLSHILSGRNKPGYDFISKFLNCFPTINADWLLTGKGKPYKDLNEISPSVFPNFQKIEDSNYLKNSIVDKKDDFFTVSSGFELESHQNQFTQQQHNQEFKPQIDTSKASQNGVNADTPKNIRKNKSVKRVIIFYSDGSFDEMYPMS